jgi:hypothetical protein
MDKKPFEQRSGHGMPQGDIKPESERKTPDEKNPAPRRPTEPPKPKPVDPRVPGSVDKPPFKSDRSDQQSGRPVQLDEDEGEKDRERQPMSR